MMSPGSIPVSHDRTVSGPEIDDQSSPYGNAEVDLAELQRRLSGFTN
jgi:hypothetical protein